MTQLLKDFEKHYGKKAVGATSTFKINPGKNFHDFSKACHTFKGAEANYVYSSNDFKTYTAQVWFDGEVTKPGARAADRYYKHPHKDVPTRLVLDLDPTCAPAEVDEVKQKILQVILDVGERLLEWGMEELDATEVHQWYADLGVRECEKEPERKKVSAHVIWPEVVFKSTKAVKAFVDRLKALAEEPEAPECYKHDDKFILDSGIYTPGRLLRAYLEKKKRDPATVLLPHEWDEDNNQWYAVSHDDYAYQFVLRDPWLPGLQPNYEMEEEEEEERAPPAQRQRVDDTAPLGPDRPHHLWEFVKSLWPKWESDVRERRAAMHGVFNLPLITLPVECPPIQQINGRLIATVDGTATDVYCPYDSTHTHTQNPGKQTFSIDLTALAVRENCHCCREPQDKHWWNLVDLSPEITATYLSRVVTGNSISELLTLFGAYANSDILYRPMASERIDGADLYLFDDVTKVWVADEGCMKTVYTRLKDRFYKTTLLEMGKVHDLYRVWKEWKMECDGLRATGADTADLPPMPTFSDYGFGAIMRMGKDWKNVASTYDSMRAQFNVFMNYVREWGGRNVQLDVEPDLVPMNDGTVLNVKTMELRLLRKEDYVTSRVGCVALFKPYNLATVLQGGTETVEFDIEHEATRAVFEWVKDLSRKDGQVRYDWASFFLERAGLSFTGHIDDRKFYICIAGGSNGKGTVAKMFRTVLGSDRYHTVPQAFFLYKADAMTGAEAPSPGTMEFLGKTCAMVEEMPVGTVGGYKIKTYSGHDYVTGRGLHKHPQSFKQKAKIWLATNQDVSFEPFDQALMDRCIVIPFDQVWSEKPSGHQLQKDPRAVTELQNHAAGFLTAGLAKLHAAYNDEGKLEFTTPPCIVQRTEEFFDKNSPVRKFIKECCDLENLQPGHILITDQQMYDAFKQWMVASTGEGKTTKLGDADFRTELSHQGVPHVQDGDNGGYPFFHKISAADKLGEKLKVSAYDEIQRGPSTFPRSADANV